MPVGSYYVDRRELDEFAKQLQKFGGDVKDLNRLYRSIAKHAAQYVKTHEPLPGYDHSKNSASHLSDGWLQAHTKGGSSKNGAWVRITGVPYLMVQEFGGGVRWYRGAGHTMQRAIIGYSKRGHEKTRMRRVDSGHIIYSKPRRRTGYFIWNVAFRLRSYIGNTLCEGIQEMAEVNGFRLDVVSRNLDIEQKPGPTG